MRIAELSHRTGVSIASIKYYMREGLLPPGELTSPNQARYNEKHVRRLRLIRALIEVGGLSVATTGDVLAAIDAPDRDMHATLGAVQRGIARTKAAAEPESAEVDEFIAAQGWHVSHDNPGRQALAEVLDAARSFDYDIGALVQVYAHAAREIAAAEIDSIAPHHDDAEHVVERMVLGSVFGHAALSAIRLLAQEDMSLRTYDPGESG